MYDYMHNHMTVGTLMNSVCSGKLPWRCSWFGLKDNVTLLALNVTTENSVLRAKPEDSRRLEQCRVHAGSKGAGKLQYSAPC